LAPYECSERFTKAQIIDELEAFVYELREDGEAGWTKMTEAARGRPLVFPPYTMKNKSADA